MPHSLRILEIYIFFIGLLGLGIGALVYLYLKALAKKEVDNIPKVPMTMCRDNKHGLYPSSASLKTTAVAIGRPDLEIEQCPFCYYENLQAAEKLLKSKEVK